MRRAAALRVAFVAFAALALPACGSSPATPPAWLAPAQAGQKDVASGTALERYFPLVDGMVYHYVTENEVGEQGMLIARAFRADAFHGELRLPGGVRRFAYAPDGVVFEAQEGPAYLLKAPIDPSASWRGEHGGTTRVVDSNAAAEVPAGRYEGCLRTLEERGGDRPIRYATTFCPGVGVVLLEAASGVSFERAALKSYAAPAAMKSDGLDVIKGPP